MKQGQFPAILPLASLDGQIGFKLDGENISDYSGYSVSAAGDINGDGHADLIIGAIGYLGLDLMARAAATWYLVDKGLAVVGILHYPVLMAPMVLSSMAK